MARNYKISQDAKADLKRIYTYGYKNWGEEQADKYYNALFDCFEGIVGNPNLYQSIDNIRDGYRRCVCGVDSIYYRIKNNNVEIMAIIGSQEFSNV